jgi:transposase
MPKAPKKTPKLRSGKVKFQVVLDALCGERNQTEIARNYGIHINQLVRWKDLFLKDGYKIFEADKEKSEKDQKKKIEELERIIGKQTVEISLLKKFLGHYRSD